MLQIAARRLRGVRLVQGLAECTGFANLQLDGVGLTYVLHELPPRAIDAALAEIRRILRPGGRVAFAEPSPLHYIGDSRSTLRGGGLRALYFRALAKIAYEPFVAQWHRRDVSRDLAEAGFRVVAHDDMVPTRFVVAERD
jgi:ubiquinone/menaquinone biosynthesis C-methylase UbiE